MFIMSNRSVKIFLNKNPLILYIYIKSNYLLLTFFFSHIDKTFNINRLFNGIKMIKKIWLSNSIQFINFFIFSILPQIRLINSFAAKLLILNYNLHLVSINFIRFNTNLTQKVTFTISPLYNYLMKSYLINNLIYFNFFLTLLINFKINLFDFVYKAKSSPLQLTYNLRTTAIKYLINYNWMLI